MQKTTLEMTKKLTFIEKYGIHGGEDGYHCP